MSAKHSFKFLELSVIWRGWWGWGWQSSDEYNRKYFILSTTGLLSDPALLQDSSPLGRKLSPKDARTSSFPFEKTFDKPDKSNVD